MLRNPSICFMCALTISGCGGAPSTPVTAGAQPAGPVHRSLACTGYRWPVKVGEDTTVSTVDLVPQPSTIAFLTAQPAPASPPPDTRAGAVERTTYRLNNVTLTFANEEPDEDYHLAVQDNRSRTMILEIPNPSCAQASPFLTEITAARSAITAKFGTTISNIAANTVISARGVGFFDFYHSQRGQAPNAIELHPVTAICFGTNCSLP